MKQADFLNELKGDLMSDNDNLDPNDPDDLEQLEEIKKGPLMAETLGDFISELADMSWDAPSIMAFIIEAVIEDGPIEGLYKIPMHYDT